MKKSHPTRTPRAADHVQATRERARPLLEATVRAMTDAEIITSMEGLVLLATPYRAENTLRGRAERLALQMWMAVRDLVAAHARGESGVRRGVRAGSAKKARR